MRPDPPLVEWRKAFRILFVVSVHKAGVCPMLGVASADIRVHYCAEQFDNDGSIGSILLKNVKRVMAGEYTRPAVTTNISKSTATYAKPFQPC